MLKGKCLCGEITYRVIRDFDFLYNCHCIDCRAFSGSAFATNILVRKDDLELDDLNKNLVRFSSSPGVTRSFCGKCGSSIYSEKEGNGKMRALHCGGIEEFPSLELKTNFHTSQKCPWVEIDKGTNNFEHGPEDRS